ncbi:MAG: MAPEG family protein [Pseudomonadales bacterium]|nr:MAPEG family protein [Pseudomonadales bacterium]
MFGEILKPDPMILPIITLVLWTLVMQAWMVIVRLPAMSAAGLDPQAAERTAELAGRLPKQVQWKADNYNHLMEQPTIFYALALALALAGLGDGVNLVCAWTYVGARVAHSIVHATINIVLYRFSLFAVGTLALLVMAINGAIQVF